MRREAGLLTLGVYAVGAENEPRANLATFVGEHWEMLAETKGVTTIIGVAWW